MIHTHDVEPPLNVVDPPIKKYVLRFTTRSGVIYSEELEGYSLAAVIVGIIVANRSSAYTEAYRTVTHFEVKEK